MNIKLKLLIVFVILAGFTACEKHDFDQPEIPNPCEANPGLKPNITIFDIQKLYNTGKLDTLDEDILSFPPDSNYVLEATITSSDEEGNFYKELYIQDSTGAMKILIDKKEIYKDFNQGQIVQIKLTGLNIQNDSYIALYTLGMGEFDGNYGLEVNKIPSDYLDDYIFRKSCPNENNYKTTTLTIGGFYDTEVGKIVKFENVEFIDTDTSKTFYDDINVAQGDYPENKTIKDCSGNQLIVRTSEYATFAADSIPNGKGSITGIMGKYGSDYQFYIIKIEDVKMDSIRCN